MGVSDMADPEDPWSRQVAARVHFAMERWVNEELREQITEFSSSPPELVVFPLLETTETMLGITCSLRERWHSGALISFWVNSNRDWPPAGPDAVVEGPDAVVIDTRMTAGVGRLAPDWVGLFTKAPFERVQCIAASVDGNVDVDVAIILAFIFPKMRAFLTYKCLEGLLERWCERENQKLMAQLAHAENNDLSFRDFELRVNRKTVRLP
jgi:hypothetical protein